MSDRENPVEADGKEVDLWTGEVRDRASKKVVAYLSPWKRRERAIATELFLATHAGPGGLQLLDIALAWTGLLEHATYLQDIRDAFNAPRCVINKALVNYDWRVHEVGIKRWALNPVVNSGRGHAGIAAARAIAPLKYASDAVVRGDYRAAMDSALSALGHARECCYARLLIGICCFVHGQQLDEGIAWETAHYVRKHQVRLRLHRDTLPELWRKEAQRRPHRWAFIEEHIRKCEEHLAIYNEMFEKALEFLRGELAWNRPSPS